MAREHDTTTHDTQEARGKNGIKVTPKEIVGLVVLLVAAIFCAQNTGDTTIRFFGGDIDSPLWVWLLGVLVVGVLVGLVLPYGRHRKD
ncbi:lipopolysaccharide assembly protein LapA domain-containing protein [Nocardioides rubriscoriae]|uniref:lipopolysaccharide assembly protein LapA domain-containing protein n=1 Tax=Nocardioides rubriscoriae TaxID=642762 RepID=UPI0011DF9446|nr:lipopolysaccharide assembly protein LapA domain-containing protein [Nocardioides rubriscoriae]